MVAVCLLWRRPHPATSLCAPGLVRHCRHLSSTWRGGFRVCLACTRQQRARVLVVELGNLPHNRGGGSCWHLAGLAAAISGRGLTIRSRRTYFGTSNH